MKKSELINYLQDIEGDFEVTTSNRKGLFCDIKSVELQKWGEGDEECASITLVLDDYYNSEKLLLRKQDADFIDNVNEDLEGKPKIDKEEALEAKKCFDNDFKEIQKKCRGWFNKNYSKITKDVMLDLFNDEEELDKKPTETLKKYVYKNGWKDEISNDDLDNRSVLLRLLYGKVDNEIKSKIDINAIFEDCDEMEDGDVLNLDMSIESNTMSGLFDNLKKAINELLR